MAAGRRQALADREIGAFRFDLLQLALVGLTLAALVALLGGHRTGLAGHARHAGGGNRSSAWQLNWYQDRIAGPLPIASVVSAPLLLYRGLMLAWALWLAFALLPMAGLGLAVLQCRGLWRRLRRAKAVAVDGQP